MYSLFSSILHPFAKKIEKLRPTLSTLKPVHPVNKQMNLCVAEIGSLLETIYGAISRTEEELRIPRTLRNGAVCVYFREIVDPCFLMRVFFEQDSDEDSVGVEICRETQNKGKMRFGSEYMLVRDWSPQNFQTTVSAAIEESAEVPPAFVRPSDGLREFCARAATSFRLSLDTVNINLSELASSYHPSDTERNILAELLHKHGLPYTADVSFITREDFRETCDRMNNMTNVLPLWFGRSG